MWQELKQKREEKKQVMQEKFHVRKEDMEEKYGKRFPKPKMERSTEHLLEKNPEDVNAQSTKTTRVILKFWLI
jgi:hypothetical protein